MISRNREAAGNRDYVYPGVLVEDEDVVNGADNEGGTRLVRPAPCLDESENDSWAMPDHSDGGGSSKHSFNSAKLIDGYKEFVLDGAKQSDLDAKSTSSRSSVSLSAVKNDYNLLAKRDHDDDKAEFDLNISFSGGYVPNTDLSRVDKGQGNPQFGGLDAN